VVVGGGGWGGGGVLLSKGVGLLLVASCYGN